MQMYYFRFEARPKTTHSKFEQYGGAYVNCWVQRETQSEAENYARGSIRDEDWVITDLDECGPISKETQEAEGMSYFEQAEHDGKAFVFYTWPIGSKGIAR